MNLPGNIPAKGGEASIREKHSDPRAIIYLIALGFFCAGLVRLGVPAGLIFDERYYVPSALQLLQGEAVLNREHPMLGKEMIALSLALFGQSPAAWRLAPLLAGTLGLVAWVRAVWWFYRDRLTAVVFAALLSTGFLLFGLSRIALLDVFMFAFTGAAMLCYCRSLDDKRWLAPCGLAIGLAVACKWAAVPVAGLLFLAVMLNDRSLRSVLCLTVLPIAAYLATFTPMFFVRTDPLRIEDLLALHLAMAARVSLFIQEHSFSSRWWQWVLNTGPIWFIGPQRYVLLAGNPVTFPFLAPAMVAVLWLGRRDWKMAAPALAYIVLLMFWPLSGKPVQYQYSYLLASTFGLVGLSVLLAKSRPFAISAAAASMAAFVWFFPVLTAGTVGQVEARFAWPPGWAVNRPAAPPASPEALARMEKANQCLERPRAC